MVSPSTPVATLGSPNVFTPALNTKHRVCRAPPSGWGTLAPLAQRSLPVWASKGDLGTGNIGLCSRQQEGHLTLILPSWECSRSSPWPEHFVSMGPQSRSNSWNPCHLLNQQAGVPIYTRACWGSKGRLVHPPGPGLLVWRKKPSVTAIQAPSLVLCMSLGKSLNFLGTSRVFPVYGSWVLVRPLVTFVLQSSPPVERGWDLCMRCNSCD